MITFLILLATILISYLSLKRWDNLISFAVFLFSCLFLLVHLFSWLACSYTYDVWYNSRYKPTKETIDIARNSSNKLELAAITNTMIEVNSEISYNQYLNSISFFDCYIDDRVDELEPIK